MSLSESEALRELRERLHDGKPIDRADFIDALALAAKLEGQKVNWEASATELQARLAQVEGEANTWANVAAGFQRELERWRHGVTIEGDFVCPDSLERDALRAQLAVAVRNYEAMRHDWSERHARVLELESPLAAMGRLRDIAQAALERVSEWQQRFPLVPNWTHVETGGYHALQAVKQALTALRASGTDEGWTYGTKENPLVMTTPTDQARALVAAYQGDYLPHPKCACCLEAANRLVNAIAQLVRDTEAEVRERCAKIAEAHAEGAATCGEMALEQMGQEIAAAIREAKP